MNFNAILDQSTAHRLNEKNQLVHDVGLVLPSLTTEQLCDLMNTFKEGILRIEIALLEPEPPQPELPPIPEGKTGIMRGRIISQEERL